MARSRQDRRPPGEATSLATLRCREARSRTANVWDGRGASIEQTHRRVGGSLFSCRPMQCEGGCQKEENQDQADVDEEIQDNATQVIFLHLEEVVRHGDRHIPECDGRAQEEQGENDANNKGPESRLRKKMTFSRSMTRPSFPRRARAAIENHETPRKRNRGRRQRHPQRANPQRRGANVACRAIRPLVSKGSPAEECAEVGYRNSPSDRPARLFSASGPAV